MIKQTPKTETENEPKHGVLTHPEVVVSADGNVQVFASAQRVFDENEPKKQKPQKESK